MKYLWKLVLPVVSLVIGSLLFNSCQPAATQTGVLQGAVTIGPIFPVERIGESRPVPPEVFSSRKVLVYDASGKKLIKEVPIQQVGQTAQGYYSVELEPGDYVVDTNQTGIGGARNLTQKITITPGGTITIDLDIDTGIR